MLIPLPAMGLDLSVSGVLASFSHFGTLITVAIIAGVAVLATRCPGRCKEDWIFRSHVI
ncbi:MAG TPA: hypothetical protein VFQ00_11640 [Terriglobales bacterium]|nr:hypothetical protein [Terriglobales bacterium]